jgi:putative N6-adenine-specific DNA methylase
MTGKAVGRGGRKLEAGLAEFALLEKLPGARAVDVGASTGGFTEVLLEGGAARVTAVDVGHGQLHERLRGDARVESLEGANWKTLALTVAPGPFDFFTVDVSFVAARSMLRGLAFRLRAGAEGVVLVKPQFELPDHLVKDGEVSDPALRARALATFRAKAEALGFALLGTMDSPVAGGSGTVEMLAHLRFDGRPSSMPRPGERKRTERPAGASREAGDGLLDWFAVAAPGLEPEVKAELAELASASALEAVEGGVTFRGPLEAGMRANLSSRVATRILLRMGGVDARTFPELRRRLRAIRWDGFVPAGPVRVEASASRCRLYHTGALAETLLLGLGDAGVSVSADPEAATRIFIRGLEDHFTLSVDSSGELLHKRGWRVETGAAPLRETLAAGILALCEHDPERPFLDPMCGAGTIVLEACARAMNVAPGLARSFAFERWPRFTTGAWDLLRDEALSAIRPGPPAPLYAFDRDEEAVETTRRNAARAGFLAHLNLERAAFGERAAPASSGLVVMNPPYGRRLAAGTPLAREVSRTLRARYGGWRVGLLAPPATAGLPAARKHPLRNGGLKVQLSVADLPGREPEPREQPAQQRPS